MAKTSTRMVGYNEFVAESLEEYADSLPPGETGKARTLRDAASLYRQLPTKPSALSRIDPGLLSKSDPPDR